MRSPDGSTKVLITGSAGFIGSHLVELLLSQTDWHIVGLDSFRHAGDSARVSGSSLQSNRYCIYTCDLSVSLSKTLKRQIGAVDVIINLASNSSVDYSLSDPESVIRNNMGSTLTMLEFARESGPMLFVHMSTDEVYGPASGHASFAEWSAIRPSNPYSASKAAQEAMGFAYWRSFGVPLVLVNATNIIGERQSAGKYVPLVVSSVLNDRTLDIHCSNGKPGSRMYLHASDCVRAIQFIADRCIAGEIGAGSMQFEPPRYNIVGQEVDNLALARRVADILHSELRYQRVEVLGLRPGHDIRYALDPARLTGLGWRPQVPFNEALERTVNWFAANPYWL